MTRIHRRHLSFASYVVAVASAAFSSVLLFSIVSLYSFQLLVQLFQ